MTTPTDAEKLAQTLRELTDACEAEYCSADTDGEGDDSKVALPEESCSITFGMIRRARAALNAHESRAQPASVPDEDRVTKAVLAFADFLHRMDDEDGWEVGPMRVKWDAHGQLADGPLWVGSDDTRRWAETFLTAASQPTKESE